jgi:hypothetical protein
MVHVPPQAPHVAPTRQVHDAGVHVGGLARQLGVVGRAAQPGHPAGHAPESEDIGHVPGGVGYSQTSFEAQLGEQPLTPLSVPASALVGHALLMYQTPTRQITVAVPPEGHE